MKTNKVKTPATLLLRLRNLDSDRWQLDWADFVFIYAPILNGFGRRYGVPDADVFDLTQEVLFVLVKLMPNFQYDPNKSFRGFLRACHRSVASEFYSKREKIKWQELVEAVTEDNPIMEEGEFRDLVMARALELMSRRFKLQVRRAFVENFLNGRPASEVAEMLGISVDSVYVYKGRVLLALKEELRYLLD